MLPPGEAWRRLRQNRRAMIGLLILLIIVLLAIFAPLVAPHDPHERHEGMRSSDEATEILSKDELPAIDIGGQGRHVKRQATGVCMESIDMGSAEPGSYVPCTARLLATAWRAPIRCLQEADGEEAPNRYARGI